MFFRWTSRLVFGDIVDALYSAPPETKRCDFLPLKMRMGWMMKYVSIPELTRSEIEEVIAKDDRERLPIAVLSAALHSANPAWAESVCLRLARHDTPEIRGNAILGFGHIARRHGMLSEKVVKPIMEAAFSDPNQYVRGQADSAADDVELFLNWQCRRPE